MEFRSLPLEVSRNMVVNFTEEEVKNAVWECGGSKSPGPDGFNFNFIKSCWEVLKADVMAAVQLFHTTGSLPKG